MLAAFRVVCVFIYGVRKWIGAVYDTTEEKCKYNFKSRKIQFI